jgi:hypothetical protein
VSNAKLRRKLEVASPVLVAAMMENGDVHDECGILEFSYHAYCNPVQALSRGLDRVKKIREVQEREYATRMRERL